MMESFQNAKAKPTNSNFKFNNKSENSAAEGCPRKCAEVFLCDHGGFTYVCLFCGEDFSKALQLEEHLLNHLVKMVTPLDTNDHLSEIITSDCHESQQTENIFAESFEMTRQGDSGEINAEDFDVFIKTEPVVMDHVIEEDATIKERWFTDTIKCDHCAETFNCQGLKNLHNRQKHNITFPYDCQECSAAFNEEDTFKRHSNLHGILNNPTCNYCKQIFEFQSDLNDHLQQQTGDARTEIQIKPPEKRKQHICHLCGKSFQRSYWYKNHIKGDHNGEFLYCDLCSYKTKDRSNLISHMRVHTKERPYSCDICGKNFATPSYIKIHKRLHTGEKPFQCNVCGLTRYSLNKLNTHIKEKHSNLPPKLYPCTVCDKKFRRGSKLKDHMRTHTGQKPFKCAICNTSFRTKKTLSEHEKLHDSIKAYECKYCGLKFAQLGSKRGHERRVHE